MGRRDPLRALRQDLDRRPAGPGRQLALAGRDGQPAGRRPRGGSRRLPRHRQEPEPALGAAPAGLPHPRRRPGPRPWLGRPRRRRAPAGLLGHPVRGDPLPVRPLGSRLVGARARRAGRHRQRRPLHGPVQLRDDEPSRAQPHLVPGRERHACPHESRTVARWATALRLPDRRRRPTPQPLQGRIGRQAPPAGARPGKCAGGPADFRHVPGRRRLQAHRGDAHQGGRPLPVRPRPGPQPPPPRLRLGNVGGAGHPLQPPLPRLPRLGADQEGRCAARPRPPRPRPRHSASSGRRAPTG